MHIQSASYLSLLFNRRKLDHYIQQCNAALQWYQTQHQVTIDAFAVTGVSGIAVGATVAHMCNKRLIVVRKADDQSTHSHYSVEGIVTSGEGNNYIFFDDLISSGHTLCYTVAKIEQTNRAMLNAIAARPGYYQGERPFAPAKFIGAMVYDTSPNPQCCSMIVSVRQDSWFIERLARELNLLDPSLTTAQSRERVVELIPAQHTVIG